MAENVLDVSSIGLADSLMKVFGYKRIMQPKIIGIGAKSRVGKDSMAKILEKKIKERGFSVIRYSLATPLKSECEVFLRFNFGISAFTENDNEKNIIRPILVEVGRAHRKQTEGKYFTNLADKMIENCAADFVIIPDVRFYSYKEDEFIWLKNKGGFFLYLDREDKNGNLVTPANEDEKINSEKLIDDADYCFQWKDFNDNLDNAEIGDLDSKILKYFGV